MVEIVEETSLEFTYRNCQQGFISKVTAEHLPDFDDLDEETT